MPEFAEGAYTGSVTRDGVAHGTLRVHRGTVRVTESSC